MKTQFYEYVLLHKSDDTFCVSPSSVIHGDPSLYAYEYLRSVLDSLPACGKEIPFSLQIGFPEDVAEEAGDVYYSNEEAYAIRSTRDRIELYGASPRALNYAVSTVKSLFDDGIFCECFLFDYPDKPVRGYRVFTPGEAHFDVFYKTVDYLVLNKFNSIIIEVGGAMQYERHPEINEKWVEFCKEMHQSPYETDRVQHKLYWWTKNAIHADNGDGGYITKDQMRTLVAYCKRRGLEVIPEIPSLSHSDYIVMAHPELNERAEDKYPDTYCPSDPATYELLFDLMDEIIDVFKPKFVHIGHDEVYTLAKCEKCRGKDPVDLYVGDITTINDHLNSLGIRTIMWCEKTYEVWQDDGWPIGGAGNPDVDIPRLADCADKIPQNVIYLDWYWGAVGPKAQQRNVDLGHEMIYGNFNPIKLGDYRIRPKEIAGGFSSNWGSFEPEYMQRNSQNFDLLCSSYIFWSHSYSPADRWPVFERICDKLYAEYCETLGKNRIDIIHTTSFEKETKPFYDGYFIVDDDWVIGWYRVNYEDGSQTLLPVKYGYNIKNVNESFSFGEKFTSVIGASRPRKQVDTAVYETSFTDPFPDKKILSIQFEPCKDADVRLISYKQNRK